VEASRAKARSRGSRGGTAQAVPFHNRQYEY